jgi:hypothetical protein
MESQFGEGSADTVYSTALTRSPTAVAALGAIGVFLLFASTVQLVYTFAEPFWVTIDGKLTSTWE